MPCQGWRCVLVRDGPALGVFGVAPGLLAVRGGGNELSGGAIEQVEKSVAVGLRDEVFAAGLARRVYEDRHLGGIPVVLVVFGELEIPVELAGVGIERKQRVTVEVVACAPLTAIGRSRISRRPEDLVRNRIVGARVPRRSAADFPGIALPGVVARLTRAGHGVEAPLARAGCSVVGVNKTADTVLATRDSDDDEILHG